MTSNYLEKIESFIQTTSVKIFFYFNSVYEAAFSLYSLV